MAADFDLFETMLAEDGSVALLDLHIERLRDSAAHFGFPFREESFRTGVNNILSVWAGSGAWKVRVTLNQEGGYNAEAEALEEVPAAFGNVVFADDAIDSSDPFFYHKTTNRAVYETAYEAALAAGYDEVLFANERGEVTEGSRTNLIIQKEDSLLTPPVTCGLLNGIYRRHLLVTRPGIKEQVLYPEDVLQADAVFLCNAIRGMQPVGKILKTKLEKTDISIRKLR